MYADDTHLTFASNNIGIIEQISCERLKETVKERNDKRREH